MKNVLLVFGGKSYEHDISVVTASQIFNKSLLEDIKLVPIYLTLENEFFLYLEKKFNVKDFSINSFKNNKKKFKKIAFVSGENNKVFMKTRLGLKEYISVDDIIFACHGGIGENGKLSAYFNMLGFGTSAGNFSALSICMDKYLFKQVMKGLKVPVVTGVKISKTEFEENIENVILKTKYLGFPVVVKPNNGGSSIGLFIAQNKSELINNLKSAFEFDNEILVEKYIRDTREFNIALVGTSENFILSRLDEPLKQNDVLTFADKYLNETNTKGKFGNKTGSMSGLVRKENINLSEHLCLKMKKIAEKIFKCLGLFGIVRIDFLLDTKSNKIYVCEVNTIPGSLAYYFFDENKITTNALIKKLIEIAEINRQDLLNFNKELLINILD